jgi:precorrin-4 methylase
MTKFSLEQQLKGSPLQFTYPISAMTSITTTVSGDARQYAVVSIVSGSLTLWSQTLTQLADKAKIPYDIVAGDLTVDAGGTLALTIPTTLQNGSVVVGLMIKTSTQTAPFNATVASWPLSS